VLAPDAVTSLEGYGAAILGSAIYMGEWMDDARALVDRLGPELAKRPVWLFSSGVLGAPSGAEDAPYAALEDEAIADLVAASGAREHRFLAGRIDARGLGLGEKTLVAAVRAPEGDFRSWAEIRDWATAIAAALTSE